MSIRQLTDGSPVPEDDSHKAINPLTGQQRGYVVLSAQERAKGFVKPYRDSYVHNTCGVNTKMGVSLSETYARDPYFYSGTFCVGCGSHFPLNQFRWDDGEPMEPTLQEEWLAGRAQRKADDERQRAAEVEQRERTELARLQAKYPAPTGLNDGRAPTRQVRCAKHGTYEILVSDPEIGNCPVCQKPMVAA